MSGVRPGGARQLVQLLAAVAAALVLAGCVSIPSNGRVVAGDDTGQQGARAALRVTAAGPSPDADERAIVEGFLAAVAGLDDYSVAREFLAPAALSWRPGEQTVIYEDLATFTPTVRDEGAGTATVAVRAAVVATIDEAGRYDEREPTTEELSFGLTRVQGQWRISELPAGVLVSEVDAGRVLAAFGVYFVDPTSRFLVPDVRWFPQLPSSATSLVRALLGGPSAPYLGALESGAPTGTRLDLSTVPVENGVATVDLTDEVLDAGQPERALLLAQLRQTLRAVPTVSAVVVTVDGSPLDEPGAGAGTVTSALVVDPAVAGSPYVLGPPPAGDGAVGTAGSPLQVEPGPDGRPVADPGAVVLRLDTSGQSVVPGLDGLAAEVSTGLAVSGDGGSFAGLDGARQELWLQQPDGVPALVLPGLRLTTPSFDPEPLGWLWTVSGAVAEGGVPTVLAAAGTVEEVEAAWLSPGDVVRALRVSRDGARVLLVVAHADGSVEVEVRGVRRDASDRPLSLSQASFVVAPELTDALDASWVNDDSVVVLGSVAEEAPRPVLAQVGGRTTSLAPTPGAVTVSAGLGERNVVVGTASGTVLRRSGGVWLDGPVGVSPAFGG